MFCIQRRRPCVLCVTNLRNRRPTCCFRVPSLGTYGWLAIDGWVMWLLYLLIAGATSFNMCTGAGLKINEGVHGQFGSRLYGQYGPWETIAFLEMVLQKLKGHWTWSNFDLGVGCVRKKKGSVAPFMIGNCIPLCSLLYSNFLHVEMMSCCCYCIIPSYCAFQCLTLVELATSGFFITHFGCWWVL